MFFDGNNMMFIKYFLKIVLFLSQDLFKVVFFSVPSSFFTRSGRMRGMKISEVGEGA
jgi:hypothetical protein